MPFYGTDAKCTEVTTVRKLLSHFVVEFFSVYIRTEQLNLPKLLVSKIEFWFDTLVWAVVNAGHKTTVTIPTTGYHQHCYHYHLQQQQLK